MKKFFTLFITCLISLSCFTELSFSRNRKRQAGKKNSNSSSEKRNNKRAATGGSARKSKSTSSSSKKKKNEKKSSSSKSSSGSSSKSSSSNENSSSSESPELKCLQDKIESLLSDKCSFIIDDNIKTALEGKDLYCVYNNKDSGKTSSIYNYYLNAYYGVSETSIKEDTSVINVKDRSKNALKYYQYLIDEITNGTLKESKILDNIRDAVLENANIDVDVQMTIEEKTVETVPLAIDIIKSDIDTCTKETKAILRECNATGNQEVKQKIKESCEIYNSALIKLAGDKKAEALGYEAEIITVLKERLKTELYSMKDSVEMQKELVKQKEELADVEKRNKILNLQNSRSENIDQITKLEEEIATIGDDEKQADLKKQKETAITTLKNSICQIEKQIKQYDNTSTLASDFCKENSTETKTEESNSASNTESNPDDKKSSET